jgi:hypothetical protein
MKAHRSNQLALWMAVAVAATAPSRAQQRPAAADSSMPCHALHRLAPTASPAEAQASLDRAVDQLAGRGGGLLVIPPGSPPDWKPDLASRQGVWRDPPPPAPARSWGRDPGVTVLDFPGGTPTLHPPQVSGMELHRILNLPRGQSLPHWGYQPMLRLVNAVLNGSKNAGVLRMDTESHNENQTFDVMLWRRHYSQGDAYLFDARVFDMGGNGEDGGGVYSAIGTSLTNVFRGRVDQWDPSAGRLVYRDGLNAHTLASGRPLINLNPSKWLSRGTVWVMHPGGARLGHPDGVRARDAGWTPEVVGRYFAVDEPGEYVPGGDRVRRWWLITGLRTADDGVQSISIQRHWWGAKDNHSVGALYRPEHYSDASAPRPLRYVIAPGANVYDASDGVESPQVNPQGSPRILRLAPGPHLGGAVDFAPGDPVEQAIGPDPFKPIAFRSWIWDSVPGVFPAPVFDVANQGAVMRQAVMTVRGGSGDVARDRAERADASPPWSRLLEFDSASGHGLVFAADTAQAAILFGQPNAGAGRLHTLRWNAASTRRMEVSDAGVMTVSGNAPLALAQAPVTRCAGLSAVPAQARNLRGIGVRPAPGARQAAVTFETPEVDDAFTVVVSLSWPAASAISRQTATGFTVDFGRPAPANATLDWALIR